MISKFKNLLYSTYYNFCYYASLNFLIIKRIGIKKKKNIAVLGKGESLNYIKHYLNKNEVIDLIILCNFSNNDLDDLNIYKKIKNIPIILLGNITEPLINKKSLKKILLYRVYINRIKNLKKKNYSSIYSSRTSYRYNSIINKIFYLPNKIEKILNYLRNHNVEFHLNCGISGVGIASSFKPDNIYIFGFDFYEKYYFNKVMLSKDKANQLFLQKLKSKFLNFFYMIIKDNKKINYYVFTKAKIKKNKLKNLRLFKV